jgi:hypothetical protein
MSQQQVLELNLNILIRMRTCMRWFVMISKLLSESRKPLLKVRNRSHLFICRYEFPFKESVLEIWSRCSRWQILVF